MSFFSLIIKNPFRNKSRAILAIIGIGIGIATIVALGGITEGLITSAEDTLHAGGTDITIISSNTSSSSSSMMGSSSFNESWINKIKSQDGVQDAIGIYSTTVMTENIPMLTVIGIHPESVNYADLTITEGRLFSNDNDDKEVIVGKVTASQYEGVDVGDKIKINNENFKVVGIFESGTSFQDMSVFMTLDNVRDIVDDDENISSIFVKVNKDADVDNVARELENKYGDNLSVITSLADVSMAKDMVDMLNGASWGISLLAIVIGGIGIINTMLMSVFERTREIGVLKAVGWSDLRILLMIVGESIVITITAGIVGSLVGVIGVELLTQMEFLGGMTPVFTLGIFAEAFIVALIVGIIGGIYPAIKAIKLPPTEALRYE